MADDDIPTFQATGDEDLPLPDPHPFRLEGKRRSDGERWVEDFAVLGDIPQGPVGDLASMVTITKDGGIRYSALACTRFLRAVIVPEDEDRWDALLYDKDRPVNIDALGPVALWAAGHASGGRPTGRLSSSTTGQPSTPDTSEADTSPEATPQAG